MCPYEWSQTTNGSKRTGGCHTEVINYTRYTFTCTYLLAINACERCGSRHLSAVKQPRLLWRCHRHGKKSTAVGYRHTRNNKTVIPQFTFWVYSVCIYQVPDTARTYFASTCTPSSVDCCNKKHETCGRSCGFRIENECVLPDIHYQVYNFCRVYYLPEIFL